MGVEASLQDGPGQLWPLVWSPPVSNQLGCMTIEYSGGDGARILRLGEKKHFGFESLALREAGTII